MTMIERVARAIEAVNRTPESSAHTQRFSTPEEVAERYRTLARAAIAAMREPTREMLDAPHTDDLLTESQGIRVWGAMIEAALNEGNK